MAPGNHYPKLNNKELLEAKDTIDLLAEKAMTQVLDPDEKNSIRQLLKRIMAHAKGKQDAEATQAIDTILEQLTQGNLISASDCASLRTAAPFVPDFSQSPEDHDAWLAEMAAIKVASFQPRSPAPVMTASPAEVALREEILAIGSQSGTTRDFLTALGDFAKELGTKVSIHRNPIMWDAARNRKAGAAFEAYGTMSSLAITRPPGSTMTLALVIPWTKSPWGLSDAEFLAQDFHAVVFAIIYPSAPVLPGVPGKALLIADPNIVSADDPNPFDTRLNTLLGVKKMPVHKFVNLPRQERNSAGICLTLALEWMVEMVIKGFEVTRDENGAVVAVENYRQL
ncbi:hypothetical protein B0H15DRAFT_972854 [Mycena belliarum]|uniref:Uncharacterized protein n=1 Tax=Mycena belliarum TaxID=1033014 RepID=A0AAD6TKY7_9AGAR|nr:hypothetical protein B0H15DRAFT_972854 [Mycena belliae]